MMQLRNMYQSDIDRDINGVIKVAQDDLASIEQELREYVVTRELHRHFCCFLDSYEKSLNRPTDQIGVWISGFFGSGKSHFLKMLSCLLSNSVIAGRKAVDYFENKFDDPLMFERLKRCAAPPTDTILFNIDSKSPINKDQTAILRVFAKVFYEYRGFCGDDLKVARLEQFIERSGKLERFKETFESLHGDSWVKSRSGFAFLEDPVVKALSDALDMSEGAARNWFYSTETAELSIEQLVKEIRDYLDSRGKDFRLIFLIDEVGQYIGTEGSLMLNLQTVVEEIGARCGGRVWVMVTSQETIDTVTKISGEDFSKIQGRFHTRLSLSSSSADEVIKKRVLAKTPQAGQLLACSYEKNSAVLKNLFTFSGLVQDREGYAGEADFVETYPFVPYQFRLMQNVLAQIRKHGNARHLSGGERSMLSGFQEAARATADKDENALVPFSLFYPAVQPYLDGNIRQVIDRCQSQEGIFPYDVELLKLLYLMRHVQDLKANVDNLATLMVEDIRADKIRMRQQLQSSLDRLIAQGYVARQGDTYTFLTQDEQEVEREIRNTPIDSATLRQTVSRIVFGELYGGRKLRYGNYYDFSYRRLVDGTPVGQSAGEVGLHILTAASDLYHADERMLLMHSDEHREAVFRVSEQYPYFDELEQAARIRKYIKSRNVTQLPEAIQQILRAKQQQAGSLEQAAREHLLAALLEAKGFVAGQVCVFRASSVKEKLEGALTVLVERIYTKLGYVTHHVDSEETLLRLSAAEATLDNPKAVAEVEQFLHLQAEKQLPTSMRDILRRFSAIPYGWRQTDIAAIVCTLMAAQKVVLECNGSTLLPASQELADHLIRDDLTLVRFKTAMSPKLLEEARWLLKEYFNTMDVPGDENGLIGWLLENMTAERDSLRELLSTHYAAGYYPDRKVVEQGVKLLDELLDGKRDPAALLKKLVSLEDALLDLMEDLTDVRAFFKDQKPVFDAAATLYRQMEEEKEYLQRDPAAGQGLEEIHRILHACKPYRQISCLPELLQAVQEAHQKLVTLKKQEVLTTLDEALQELRQVAAATGQDVAEKAFSEKYEQVNQSSSFVALDAMKMRIIDLRQTYLEQLLAEKASGSDTVSAGRGEICPAARLESKEDIERYAAQMKATLQQMLHGHDALHII